MLNVDVPKEDLTGREYNRWTVKSYAGRVRIKGNTYETWVCECECGNTATINKFNFVKGYSRQCHPCGRKDAAEKMGDGRSRCQHYNLWKYHVLEDCCRAWRDPFAFYEWFRAAGNGRNILKKNQNKPHSPANSYRSSSNQNGAETRRLVLAWLISKGDTKAGAEARLDSVSHQRMYQLFNMSKGLCSNCSEPLENARHCAKHAQEARERSRARRQAIG